MSGARRERKDKPYSYSGSVSSQGGPTVWSGSGWYLNAIRDFESMSEREWVEETGLSVGPSGTVFRIC